MIDELVRKSRSFRSFDHSKKISEQLLVSYIETLRFTPSSINLQALKYCLITSEEDTGFVRSYVKFAGLLENYNGPDGNNSPVAYLVICQDTDIHESETLFLRDVGVVAQTFALRAIEDGIGCCMIGSFNREKVAEYLKLKDNIKPNLILALGYPNEGIILEDAVDSVAYYRDENNVHHVPKRTIKELIIKGEK